MKVLKDLRPWADCPIAKPRNTWAESDVDRERIKSSYPNKEFKVVFSAGRYMLQWRTA